LSARVPNDGRAIFADRATVGLMRWLRNGGPAKDGWDM